MASIALQTIPALAVAKILADPLCTSPGARMLSIEKPAKPEVPNITVSPGFIARDVADGSLRDVPSGPKTSTPTMMVLDETLV